MKVRPQLATPFSHCIWVFCGHEVDAARSCGRTSYLVDTKQTISHKKRIKVGGQVFVGPCCGDSFFPRRESSTETVRLRDPQPSDVRAFHHSVSVLSISLICGWAQSTVMPESSGALRKARFVASALQRGPIVVLLFQARGPFVAANVTKERCFGGTERV